MYATNGHLSNICLWTFYFCIFFIANNLAVGLSSDECGITRFNTNKIHYTWTISNYSLNNMKPGDTLSSPTFSADDSRHEWQLRLHPKGNVDAEKDWVTLWIFMISNASVAALYEGYILNRNGEKTNQHSSGNIATFESWIGRGWPKFISQSDLQNKMKNLLPDDSLTVYVEILEVDGPTNDSGHCKYSNNVRESEDVAVKLLESGYLSDIQLLVGGQVIKAHRAILAAQSSWFADQFTKNPKLDSVRMENTTMATAWQVVRFMYMGKIEFGDSMATEMLVLSDQFGIPKLKLVCEEILCKTSKPTKALDFMKSRVAKMLG